MTEHELNFQEAIQKMQAYLDMEDLTEKVSSVSITFTADWTGQPESYVIDTETSMIAPRLFSLETGHISKSFTMPSKLTETILTDLDTSVASEFLDAHNELVGGAEE